MAKNKANIDKKTLDELKKSLMDKRKEIQGQLSAFAKKNANIKDDYKTEFPHIGDEEDENTDEVIMYQDNLGVEHKLEEDILAVNEALKRIEDGTYGICYNCGEPRTIEIDRLKAFPEAKTCLKCDGKC